MKLKLFKGEAIESDFNAFIDSLETEEKEYQVINIEKIEVAGELNLLVLYREVKKEEKCS